MTSSIISAEVFVVYAQEWEVAQMLDSLALKRLDLPGKAHSSTARPSWPIVSAAGTRCSPLPDLYIGAHAALSGSQLLTREVQRYRTHLPEIEIQLIAPG